MRILSHPLMNIFIFDADYLPSHIRRLRQPAIFHSFADAADTPLSSCYASFQPFSMPPFYMPTPRQIRHDAFHFIYAFSCFFRFH